MKKLTKLLCAALVWVLLLGAAVSCAKQPDSPVQDPPKQEDPQPAPAAAAGLRIAVDSEPAWSAAVQWLASEQGQALFGDADVHDVFFLVDPQDITQQLRLSNYDAAILCPDQQTLQQLGGYESIPLFRDAVIFVHGDIGQPRGDYDLTADAIRQIYAGSGALFTIENLTYTDVVQAALSCVPERADEVKNLIANLTGGQGRLCGEELRVVRV